MKYRCNLHNAVFSPAEYNKHCEKFHDGNLIAVQMVEDKKEDNNGKR